MTDCAAPDQQECVEILWDRGKFSHLDEQFTLYPSPSLRRFARQFIPVEKLVGIEEEQAERGFRAVDGGERELELRGKAYQTGQDECAGDQDSPLYELLESAALRQTLKCTGGSF